MATDQVKKRTSDPAGYDSFNSEKKAVSRTIQLQHGEEKGFEEKKFETVLIGGLAKDIREWKENGKPLENVIRVKAVSYDREENLR